MLKNSKYITGFTLIELLIVVIIVGLLAVFIFSALTEYRDIQVAKAAVVEVTSIIKETRQKTVAAETTTQFGVYFATSSLVVFQGNVYDASNSTNKTFSVPGMSLRAQLSDSSSTLIFTRLTGEPSATGTIDIGYARLNSTTTITIKEAGLIE